MAFGNPYAFAFDLETTGLPSKGGQVMPGIYNLYGQILDLTKNNEVIDEIQLWLKVADDKVWSTFSLNNIQEKGVADVVDGVVVYRDDRAWVDQATGMAQLYEFLNRYTTADGTKTYRPVPLGHNVARFDVPVLQRALFEYLNTEIDKVLDYHAIDTCIGAYIDLLVANQEIGRVSLNVVAPFFNITNPAAHDAKGDVETTVAVFNKLVSRARRKASKPKPDKVAVPA